MYYRVLKRVIDEEIKLVPMVFFIAGKIESILNMLRLFKKTCREWY